MKTDEGVFLKTPLQPGFGFAVALALLLVGERRYSRAVRRIEAGELDKADNPLKNAPHTAEAMSADDWKHGYTRREAAFPAPWTRDHKYWPPVARVDNAYGDRNLMCTCPPMESFER